MNQMYEQKYLKYKAKYLELKTELEGGQFKYNPFKKEEYDTNAEITNSEAEIKKYEEIIAQIKKRDAAELVLQSAQNAVLNDQKIIESATSKKNDHEVIVSQKKEALTAEQTTLNDILKKHGIPESVPVQNSVSVSVSESVPESAPVQNGGQWNWNPFGKVSAELAKYQKLLAIAKEKLSYAIQQAIHKKRMENLQNAN
jgi:hypothetical protein